MTRLLPLLALVACVTTRAPAPQEGQCGAPPRPVRGNNVHGDQGPVAAPAPR